MGNGFGLKLKNAYKHTHDFLTEKWVDTHEEDQASRPQRFAHFWLLVFKSFARNKGPLRATALAYTTLLGLVPLLAVGFGITSSFLKEKGNESTRELIEQFVDAAVPQLKLLATDTNKLAAVTAPAEPTGKHTTPRDEVVDRINGFIQNAQSTTLGVSGMIGFILVAILLLSTIEDTFNDIWGVTRGRSWFRRFVQYWTTISLGPLILAVVVALLSSGVFKSRSTVESKPRVQTIQKATGQSVATAQAKSPPTRQPKIFSLIARMFLPFVLVSISFALFYKLMPNTQVYWRAAVVAGAVGGTLWLLLNIFNTFQLSRVVSMSRIYGTLALIPIFLLGLYFSWLILLFGAQVAYALQNRKVYLQERKAESVNQRGREYVAFRVITYLAQRFEHGARPATILELATLLGVPSRLIGRVLQPLIQAGIVLEVSATVGEAAYTPGRPLEAITCHDVLRAMRVVGGQELATRDEPTRVHVCAEFDRICEAERQAASVVPADSLHRSTPRSPQSRGIVETRDHCKLMRCLGRNTDLVF
jgi:membrane protein